MLALSRFVSAGARTARAAVAAARPTCAPLCHALRTLSTLTPPPAGKQLHQQASLQRFSVDPAEESKFKITNERLAVIGAGKMAEAIVGGMLRSRTLDPSQITVSDHNRDRLTHFKELFNINTARDNMSAIRDADIVLIAVKPQSMPLLMPTIAGKLAPSTLLISIVAGYTLQAISAGTGVSAVVRSMPNTPAIVGSSMTVWTTSADVNDTQLLQTKAILGSFGSELYLVGEEYLDMATAIVGSGPAYFFMVVEAMIDAGVHMGIPRKMAKSLVLKTIQGTAELAVAIGSNNHIARLRNDITSPGGTTASALYQAERGGLRTVIIDAVWASYRRSLEIGGKNSCVGPDRYIQQGITLSPSEVEKMLEAAAVQGAQAAQGAQTRATQYRPPARRLSDGFAGIGP